MMRLLLTAALGFLLAPVAALLALAGLTLCASSDEPSPADEPHYFI